jgi:rhodanese-related sulfurtransferase
MKTITRQELQEMIETRENLVIVDVLTPASYNKAHIKGAINIPAEKLRERVEQEIPDKENSEVVLYCAQLS